MRTSPRNKEAAIQEPKQPVKPQKKVAVRAPPAPILRADDLALAKIKVQFNTGNFVGALEQAKKDLADVKLTVGQRQWIQDQLPTIFTSIGWALIQKRDCQKAIPQFDQAMQLKASSASVKGSTICHLTLENIDLALESCQLYFDQYDFDKALFGECLSMFERQEKYLEAIAWIKRLKIKFPEQLLDQYLKKFADLNQNASQAHSDHGRYFVIKFSDPELLEHHHIILTTLQSSLDQLEDYGLGPPSHKIYVNLYNRSNFLRLGSKKPSWSHGIFDGQIRVMVDIGLDKRNLKKILTHELVHALLAQKTHKIPLPYWLNEGLAQYFECDIVGDCRDTNILLRNKKFLPEGSLLKNFTKSNATLAKRQYAQSLFLVRTLSQEFSSSGVAEIITNIHSQSTQTDTILEKFDTDFKKLYQMAQKKWNLKYVKKTN